MVKKKNRLILLICTYHFICQTLKISTFLVASQDSQELDKSIRDSIVERIFYFIEKNNFYGIQRLFKSLQPEKHVQILNSTVHGCSPLYTAVNHGRIILSRYLIKLSLAQGRHKMLEIWKNTRHPFIAAIRLGNKELMKLILRNMYDINDNIYGHLSPLMMAVYLRSLISVQLIVSMGADINRPCIHGRTPLMNSTFDYDICCYLISQGANVNQQDEEGFTALHLAVTNYIMPCITPLINAGADVRIRNHEGMNPLTWAAMNINDEAVCRLFFQQSYSKLDLIESLEILNACCVCVQNVTLMGWKKALQTRVREGLPKKCQIHAQEIFDFSQEFTTETELETIGDNLLLLAFQGILVIERILGQNNRLYLQILLQTALIAKQRRNFDKLKHLIYYIQEYCQETSFVALNYFYFNNLFNEIAKCCDVEFCFEYGGFTLFKIIVQATVKMWTVVKDQVYKNPFLVDRLYCELVDTFLYMTSAVVYLNLYQPYVNQFKKEVSKVVRVDPRLLHRQSLLHRVIKFMVTNPWNLIPLLRVLLETGADGNAKDCFQRTPIVYAFQNVTETLLNEVLTLFKEYGLDPMFEHSEEHFLVDSTE